MANFPADWQVFPDTEYTSFERIPLADTGSGVDTLVPFSAAGRSSGNFRVHIFGSEGFSVRFPLAKIMHDLPPGLADLQAELSASLADITPPANTTTTAWEDAEDLYKKRALLLSTPQGNPAPEAQFFEYLRSPSSDKSCIGASLRWAVAGTRGSAGIQAELQSLPTQARFLSKPNLKADNSVSVLVVAFKLNADLFDGTSHAGPVPLIFSPDRASTEAAFINFPATLHDDITTINNHFLLMEHLTLGEAVAYLQKGKARKGAGISAFQLLTEESAAAASKAKKARYQQVSPTETGTFWF